MAVHVRVELSATKLHFRKQGDCSYSTLRSPPPTQHTERGVYSLSKLDHGSARLQDTEISKNSGPKTEEIDFNLIQTKFCFQNSLGQVYLTSTTRNQRVCEKYDTSQIAREKEDPDGGFSYGKTNQLSVCSC